MGGWLASFAVVALVAMTATGSDAPAAEPTSVVLDPPDEGAAAVIARYRASIPELLNEQSIPGLAIAVVDGDHVIWAEGFGVTEPDGREPVTVDTMFSVQSMSKLFTATAVMQAVGEGKLDLDVPITTYLPEFTVHSAFEAHPETRITLRMLLAHTAGLTHEAPVGNNFDDDASDWDAHIRSISDTWLRFPVGSGYAYSNLGIDLAGHILEVVAGVPFPVAMERSLLGPLGMRHSTFDAERILGTTDRAVGKMGLIPAAPPILPMTAAGGLYASIADLATFLRFQLGDGVIDGRAVLDPALMTDMRTVPAPHAGAPAGYALGVARTRWRAGRYLDLFDHGGGGWGFLSDLWWLPQLQLGVAVLSNSSEHDLQGTLALTVLQDLVSEPRSAYQSRFLAIPYQTDVPEPDARFDPPADLQRLVKAAAMAPTGDEAERSGDLEGAYGIEELGLLPPMVPANRFVRETTGPTFYADPEEGTLVRHALVEVEPGLFLADDGEMLDFRGPVPTWRSLPLIRVPDGPSAGSWLLVAAAVVVAIAWVVSRPIAVARRRRTSPTAVAAGPVWPGRLRSGFAAAAALLMIGVGVLLVSLPRLVDSGFIGWLELPLPYRLMLHAPLALMVATVALVVLVIVTMARRTKPPTRAPSVVILAVASGVLTLQLAAWGLIGWGFG